MITYLQKVLAIWRLLNNGQNPGNADRMGISGVAFCRLALKWL